MDEISTSLKSMDAIAPIDSNKGPVFEPLTKNIFILTFLIIFFWFFLQILVYILLAVFLLDLFFRYRAYKNSGADVTASNPTATAASGGEMPKY